MTHPGKDRTQINNEKEKTGMSANTKSTRPTCPFKLCDEVMYDRKKDTEGTRRKDEKIAAARKTLERMTLERDCMALNDTWTESNEKKWRKLKTWIDMVDACNRTQRRKEELATFVGCNVVWAPHFGEDDTEEEKALTRRALQEFNDACDQLHERRRWHTRR
jgi:hypothetical protein